MLKSSYVHGEFDFDLPGTMGLLMKRVAPPYRHKVGFKKGNF